MGKYEKCLVVCFSLLVLFSSCFSKREPKWISSIEKKDTVSCGRYNSEGIRYLIEGSGEESMMNKVRREIERFPEGMRKAASFCPRVENTDPFELDFSFRSAFFDSSKRKILLYFFAPVKEPHIYAGYGEEFLVDEKRGIIDKIYVFPVPLE